MKTSVIWTIVVAALLCVNIATLVMVWHKKRPAPPGGDRQQAGQFLVTQLGLTKTQTAKFDSLRDIHHRTVDSLNKKTHLLKDALFGNLQNGTTAPKAVDSIAALIGHNAALIDEATFYHFEQVRAMLTPVQQGKFDKIIQRVLRMMATPAPPAGPGGHRRMGPPPGNGQQGPPPENGPQGPPPGGGRQGMPPGPPPGN